MRKATAAAVVAAAVGVLAAGACAGRARQRGAAAGPVYELANGRWFDGHGFAPGTFYSAAGTLTRRRPARVDSVIDLAGRFVVPPFGEAHNHNLSRPPAWRELAPYVRDGVLYVMIQSVPVAPRAPAESVAASPPVEVVYAGAALTPSGGHVVEVNERIVDRGSFPGVATRAALEGRAFHVIDRAADLDTKWPAIAAARPALVKLFLGFSEDHERRRDSSFHGKRGLDPSLVPEIVRRAHAAGARVSAHVETAEDFRVAVRAGADLIAHLSAWRAGADAGTDPAAGPAGAAPLLLADADARLAAEHGVAVVTTVLAGLALRDPRHPNHETLRSVYRRNFETLRRNGVTIALGSDFYGGTALAEAHMLGTQPLLSGGPPPLGLLDNLALLRMWSETTPRVILPGRRIGRLAEGYEASFLALEGDPVADFTNVRRIALRMKGGRIVR